MPNEPTPDELSEGESVSLPFDPLGLPDDEAERLTPEVSITMPRVRVHVSQADAAAQAAGTHPRESEFWSRLQEAAQLARAGDAAVAVKAFEDVVSDVVPHEVAYPALSVIGAKAAYNRAVVLEKLLRDLPAAEVEMERIHERYGGGSHVEARTVAGRAGLHAARLAAVNGHLSVALARYRDRLGRFRDVLPPSELQTFHADYLRQRSAVHDRGLETTARMSALPSVPNPPAEPPATAFELRALEVRIANQARQTRDELRAELEALRERCAALEEQLANTQRQHQEQLDRVNLETSAWREDARADLRLRLRLLRSDMQRVVAAQKRDRWIWVGLLGSGLLTLGLTVWLFKTTLTELLAQIAR
ncbi:MAG TPA: hypothetical protein VFS42_09385 [Burkholderiaceae bacterium]|nr:hypothetical protein [Burkholderiaceae bacterium]